MNTSAKTVPTLLALASAFFASTALSFAATQTVADFQDQTAGQQPAGPNVSFLFPDRVAANGATNSIRIADSTTSPADPFGGAGNKSLYLKYEKNTAVAGGEINSAQFALPGYTSAAPLASGTLSFDVWGIQPASGTGQQYFEFSLTTATGDTANGRGASIAAVQVSLTDTSSTGTVRIFNGTTQGSKATATTTTFPLGVKNTFAISWDAGTDSWSLKLNDETVMATISGSLVSSFVQPTNQAGASAVRFTFGDPTNTSVGTAYFVDNITLTTVPEPAGVALVGSAIAALAALALRRKKR
jgi:hypothetical protein